MKNLPAIRKHCNSVEQKLFSAFDKRKTHLLDIAKEIYPIGRAGLERGVEELADGFIYDDDHRMLTTGPLDALRRGAAGFHGNLTSPATHWFRFRLPSFMVKNGELTHEQKVLLDSVTEATEWTFARSNAYKSLHKLYEHILAFGFGCMLVSADKERICRCETLRVGTYALGIGTDGMVDTCVRRLSWTADQIIREFGKESVPQYILDGKDDPIKRYEIVNIIEPNSVGDAKANDEIAQAIEMDDNTIYRSIFWLKGVSSGSKNDGILRVIGFSIRPIVAPRLEYEIGDIYGRGRGDDALDLSRGCQSFKFDELNIVGRQSEPAFIADSELKDEGLKLYRGAINYARFGEQRGSMAMPVIPNPPSPKDALAERMDAMTEIAKLFFNDAFSVIDAVKNGQSGKMTATEVEVHVRDAMQRLAPVATIFDSELLDPLVSIIAKYTIPKMPTPLTDEQVKLLSTVNVEYVSTIHLAQKQSSISGIVQVLQYGESLAKMGKPEVLYRIDGDRIFCRLAELVGYPEKCLTTDEAYKTSVEEAKKAAAQRAQLEELEAKTRAQKDLASAPVDDAHAGGMIARSIQNREELLQ